MSEDHADITEKKTDKRKRRRKRVGSGLWGLAKLSVLLVAVGLILFAMSGKPFTAPEWMRARILEQLNSAVSDGNVQFQTIELKFEQGFKPTVTVQNLALRNASGVLVAQVANASASLSPRALLKGEVHPSDVRLTRATVNLRRTRNGEFDLGFGVDVGGADVPTATLGELLDSIDHAFEVPVLAAIETVTLSHLTLNFADARARRGWLITDGQVRLLQDAQKLRISLGFDLDYGGEQAATAALMFETEKGSPSATFAINVEQIAARDLASQIPALAWLGVLDAPISGALRTEIGEDGLLGAMNGTLEIGEGSLRPTVDARAIAFNSGRAYFGYDPVAQKIRFDELSVQTEAGKVVVEGQAYLREVTDGVPAVMLGQFRILEGEVNPEGVFVAPVVFSGGAADMRLRLNPFTLTVGQAVIEDGAHSYLVKGEVKANATGWHLAMDAKVDKIDPDRMLALWPVAVISNTREWIDENVNSARLFNINGSLRVNTGAKPVFALGYEFADADVQFMKTMPPVRNGAGHGSIAAGQLTVVVAQGQVTTPVGGVLDVTGTVFTIPDIDIKESPAQINLKASGPIQAAMS
ncbi:MAG: hypothetical protein KAT26_06175, partial [Marinosulfonomonas sp.]|nr:hypothetical protein [Marinosulfonomonas sp.]